MKYTYLPTGAIIEPGSELAAAQMEKSTDYEPIEEMPIGESPETLILTDLKLPLPPVEEPIEPAAEAAEPADGEPSSAKKNRK